MRIAIILNEHGELADISADEDIDVLIIDPKVPEHRVYLYSSVDVGAEHADALIGSDRIGHADDGLLTRH